MPMSRKKRNHNNGGKNLSCTQKEQFRTTSRWHKIHVQYDTANSKCTPLQFSTRA